MCDVVFEKTQGQGGTVNITSVYAEAAVRSVLRKDVLGNFAEFTRKYL